MSKKVKTDGELQAWDQYAAAAFATSYKTVQGRDERDYVLRAAERAAEIADALLKERRERC
ncbi:hypothetical protein [Pseudomonas sp. Irchel 3A5]|uniref:hypothetical protein n=1 Tax=Pseudomonas sp. Irchel 3A5 TaxID=2008911 RepID=UPI00114060C3|nr:hypothetical protein [Pseudomonas sp. Irchel 3A5]